MKFTFFIKKFFIFILLKPYFNIPELVNSRNSENLNRGNFINIVLLLLQYVTILTCSFLRNCKFFWIFGNLILRIFLQTIF